jgi:hypothetical protein
MSRPVSVTASAVVAILGSIFVLLVAVFSVASLFVQGAQPQPPNSAQAVLAGATIFVALAGAGIWTSVGLFRLRSWARMSILVFAGFLAVGCIFGLLTSTIVPIPPAMSADTAHVFRLVMVAMFGVPLAIAIWWLIQFNIHSTKAAFASATPVTETASPRPVSITIIAWASLIGGASCVLGILTRFPAFLFGATFNGWTAGVIYALFGALSLYIGKGLLDLREEARILAIGWFGFTLIHASLVTFVPPLRRGFLESQRSFAQNQPNALVLDEGVMIYGMFVLAVIVAATGIWLLVRNRAAFGQTETA